MAVFEIDKVICEQDIVCRQKGQLHHVTAMLCEQLRFGAERIGLFSQ